MAIEKHLVAKVGETGQLFFVSGADRFDGLYIDGENQYPVSFMSFVSDNDEVLPLKDNDYQRFLWSMNIDDPEWQKEFMVSLPKNDSLNPYNKKVNISLSAMEKTLRPKLFNKHINR